MFLSLGEKPKTAEAFGHKLEGGGETTTNGVGKHITKVAVKAISKHFCWRGIGLNGPKMPRVKLDIC